MSNKYTTRAFILSVLIPSLIACNSGPALPEDVDISHLGCTFDRTSQIEYQQDLDLCLREAFRHRDAVAISVLLRLGGQVRSAQKEKQNTINAFSDLSYIDGQPSPNAYWAYDTGNLQDNPVALVLFAIDNLYNRDPSLSMYLSELPELVWREHANPFDANLPTKRRRNIVGNITGAAIETMNVQFMRPWVKTEASDINPSGINTVMGWALKGIADKTAHYLHRDGSLPNDFDEEAEEAIHLAARLANRDVPARHDGENVNISGALCALLDGLNYRETLDERPLTLEVSTRLFPKSSIPTVEGYVEVTGLTNRNITSCNFNAH